MSARTLVKSKRTISRLVAVIASPISLARATRLRQPPDFFELRLDALRGSLGEVERALVKLRAPLILTARHPSEGGQGKLSIGRRRELLLRFLAHAAFVDLELRSVGHTQALIEEIRHRQVGLILSHHDFRGTPSLAQLRHLSKTAGSCHPDIFKIATRTDNPAQLARLVSFFIESKRGPIPLAAMGIGKLGLASRLQLDHLGSVLTYVALGEANTEGQPSLGRLRRARRAYIR